MRFFYDAMKFEFIVNILSATNLKSSNSFKKYSYFVSLTLDLDRKESKIINNTNCPVWDEDFIFKKMSDKYLKSKDILITIFDYHKLYNKSTPIAEVIIELKKADFSNRLYSYPLSLYCDEEDDNDLYTPTPIHRLPTDEEIPFMTHAFEAMKTYNTYEYSDEEFTDMNSYSGRPDYASRLISPNDRSKGYKTPINNELERFSAQRNMSPGYEDFHIVSDKYSIKSNDRYREKSQLRGIYSPENIIAKDNEVILYSERKQEERTIETFSDFPNISEPKRKYKEKYENLNSSETNLTNVSGRYKENGLDLNISELENIQKVQMSDLSDREDSLQRLHSSDINENRKRRPSVGQKFSTVLGFSKKCNSTSNLDRKSKTSFQRSEEVLPRHLKISTVREEDLLSYRNGGISPVTNYNKHNHKNLHNYNEKSATLDNTIMEKNSDSSSRLIPSYNQKAALLNENHIENFVEGLGPGQIVGCQVLGIHSMGELQMSFIDRKGKLDIEIIRARNLIPKSNCKSLPQLYVKVYLMDGKNVIEKQKTSSSNRRTLDPLFQQQLSFAADYQNRILQATVWGEYSRMDKKTFMGRCEICLENLDFSSIVFGWYKLYSVIASKVSHGSSQAR